MRKFYDFKCDNCGHRWEEYVDLNHGDVNLLCLECHSTKARRVVSAPMIGGETPYKTLSKSGIPDRPIYSGRYTRSK